MSPDERAVLQAIVRAGRRAIAFGAAEAIFWGAGAAAFSPIAALAIVIVVAAWRVRRAARTAVVRALDRDLAAQNVLVTADELLRGTLDASSEARRRVFARAASVSERLRHSAATSRTPALRAAVAASLAWGLVWTAGQQHPLGRLAQALVPERRAPRPPAIPGALRLTVTSQPPSYTGMAAATSIDPPQIAALQGSRLTIVIDTGSNRVTADHDGMPRAPVREAPGHFVDHIELAKNGYYAVETEAGRRRVIPIVVLPDALPAVRITAPGRDLVVPDRSGRVAFEVQASDDFGLRALSLEYTKVSGSGEQFEFHEGDIPLTITKTSDREWRASAVQSIGSLNLAEGDTLVYRAVAADRRPGDGSASSDAFFIELSSRAIGAGDAFTIPDEETRYALSQQMLIVKTARLDDRRASMPAADFHEAALNLAVEQRMIRAELVFMLGGEIEDEEVEAQQSTELQEGRLQNRGQRDLRAATVAMSQAEKLLTASSPRDALTAERAAVAALERAFSRDRYILRALPGRAELDPKRRLTGSVADTAGWRRDRRPATPNRRAALLQDLLLGLGTLGSETAALELAREAVRIDADSDAMRRVARDLQRVADAWPTTAADVRRREVDRVASAVASEAAGQLAAPPLAPPFPSAALAGALADALRGGLR